MTLTQRYPGAAVVTGASAGIGESFANALAAEGVPLVLVARRKDRLESLAERLRNEYDVDVWVAALDLTEPGAVTSLRAFTDGEGIQVGMVVNNAGFGSFGRHDTVESAHYSKMVDLNCKVPTEIADAYLRDMLERKSGALIFVASTAAYQAVPYMSAYAATKAYNLILAEGLAQEYRGTGVDVLAVSPGFTETEFAEAASVDARAPGLLVGYPDGVVRQALRALGNRPSTIHGWLNWILNSTSRLFPRWIVGRLVGNAIYRSSPRLRSERHREV